MKEEKELKEKLEELNKVLELIEKIVLRIVKWLVAIKLIIEYIIG